MVRTDVPDPPVMDDGEKPPFVIPVGNPPSVATLRLTVPVKAPSGVTSTVKCAACPGSTVSDDGVTSISKSGVDGVTVMKRVGGCGSEFPLASITVREATYSPAVSNRTFPGFFTVEADGVPPGKTQA